MDGNKNNETLISRQQAIEIALKRVPGEILEAIMEYEKNGSIKYEVLIATPDNRIFEVNMNAKDGIILKVKEKNMGSNNKYGTPNSRQQVKKIALGRVPGEVLEVTAKYGKNDDIVYKVLIMTPENKIFEIKINEKD